MSTDDLISLFALVRKNTRSLHILEKDDQLQIDFGSSKKLNEYDTNSLFEIKKVACKLYSKKQLRAQIVVKK